MRVAHILRKYDAAEWGGTETAILQLTSGLATHGVNSVVYAPRLANASTAPDPLVSPHCDVRRFRAVVPIIGISAERKRQMVAVGGNIVSFDLLTSLRHEQPLEIVHSHVLGRIGAIARAAARSHGVPFVLSVHGGAYDLPTDVKTQLNRNNSGGFDWGRPVGLLLRARHLFSEADAIVTCNPREAQLISERHPQQRVVVQPHGVPAALFARDQRAAARAAFPEIVGRKVLLQPGRIDDVKNQAWVVAQVAALARRHPDALIVFVGAVTDEAYGKALHARIECEGLGRHIFFAGKLPAGDPRLIGLFQEARAVLLPSRSETFGLVILEAWAAGTPTISSRTSGAMSHIVPDANGALFDLNQPEMFHAAVDRVLHEPELRAAWGEAGRMRVVADHDAAVLAGRLEKLYRELQEAKHALRHSA